MLTTLLLFFGFYILFLLLKRPLEKISNTKICPICWSLLLSGILLTLPFIQVDKAIPATLLGGSLIWIINSLEGQFKNNNLYFGYFKLLLMITGFTFIISIFDQFLWVKIISGLILAITLIGAYSKKNDGRSKHLIGNQGIKNKALEELREKLKHCCD